MQFNDLIKLFDKFF